MLHANLTELPLPDASVDVVVNFQVIEHLWDQGQFIRECARVLRPAGLLMVSTPNRITFSPAATPRSTRSTPANSTPTSSPSRWSTGIRRGGCARFVSWPAAAEMDARHGGSIIEAQIERAVADAPWSPELVADVAAVATADFDLLDRAVCDIDDSLDLVAIAVRN